MSIPAVAARLRELAREHRLPELDELAQALRRRSTGRVKPRSVPMTDEIRAQIRACRAENPEMTQAEIGRRFNVNQGRVYETLYPSGRPQAQTQPYCYLTP